MEIHKLINLFRYIGRVILKFINNNYITLVIILNLYLFIHVMIDRVVESEDIYCKELDYDYNPTNRTAILYSLPKEYNGDVVVPEEATVLRKLLKVTSVGSSAFRYCGGV